MGKPTPPHIPPLRKILKSGRTQARKAVWRSMDSFAEAERKHFQDRILAQDFESFRVVFYPESGTNLSPAWIRRKQAAGADLRTMLATHHYLRSIRTFRDRDNTGLGKIRVGFEPRKQARNLEGDYIPFTLNKLALTHEYGSLKRNIPARPHWRPHLNTMKREAKAVRARLSKQVVKLFREQI